MREVYGPRIKTLATIEYLGETFRVCYPRHNGKAWMMQAKHSLKIVHGDREVYSAFCPYAPMTVERAIARFLTGARNFERHHGAGARDAMLKAIADMKAPR